MLAAGACFVLFVAIVSRPAQAVVIAEEDFESYTNGTSIINGTGGTGWAQSWIGNTTTGAPIAIASSGKISGYGQSLELGGTADNRGIAVRQFPDQTGDVYIGMVLQTTNGWDADFWQIYVNNTPTSADSTTPSFAAGLFNEATTNPYFVRKGSATAGVGSTNKSTLSHTSVNNDIHTFVAKFSKSTGLATDLYDQVALWIDQSTEGTPTAVLGAADIGTAALNSATISTLHMRISSLETTDRVYLDNVRVATTYAEAVDSGATSGLQGDFNHNTIVDAADYVVWRKNPGGTFTPADYGKWRANFGAGAPPPPPPPLPTPPPHGAVRYSETFGGATVPANWSAQNGSQGPAILDVADDSAGIGGGNALSINAFTRQGVIGTFDDVSLANVGDMIQLRFDVRLTSIPNNAGGFRFGLYNDNGPALSSGYRALVGTGTGAPRTDVQADGGDDVDGDIGFGTNRENPPNFSNALHGITDNNPHSFIFALTRTANGVLIDVFEDGQSNLLTSVEHIPGTGAGTATPLQTVFNQIAITTNGGILGLIDNVSIEFLAGGTGSGLAGLSAVPEPATGILLAICAAGLTVVRRGRTR